MARKCSSAALRRWLPPLRRGLALLLTWLLLRIGLLLPRLRRRRFDARAPWLAAALLLIQFARAHFRARPELVLSLDDEPLARLQPLGDDGEVALDGIELDGLVRDRLVLVDGVDEGSFGPALHGGGRDDDGIALGGEQQPR